MVVISPRGVSSKYSKGGFRERQKKENPFLSVNMLGWRENVSSPLLKKVSVGGGGNQTKSCKLGGRGGENIRLRKEKKSRQLIEEKGKSKGGSFGKLA